MIDETGGASYEPTVPGADNPPAFQAVLRKALQDFVAAEGDMLDAHRTMAAAYVAAIDAARREGLELECRQAFWEARPNYKAEFWRDLEAIGRGMMDSRLLAFLPRETRMLKSLSLDQQARVLDGRIALVTADGDELQVRLIDMTPDQRRQVMAADHIRDVAEQRVWLDDRLKQTRLRAAKLDAQPTIKDLLDKGVQIKGRQVTINATMHVDELARLVDVLRAR